MSVLAEQLHGERAAEDPRRDALASRSSTRWRMEMTRYSLGQLIEETGVSVADVQNRMVDFGVDAFWMSHEPWIVPAAVHAGSRRDVVEGRHRLLDRRAEARLRGSVFGTRAGQDRASQPGDSQARAGVARRAGSLGDDVARVSTQAPRPLMRIAEPWTLEEKEWRRLVGRVRAGRALRPQRWPNGARCAVAFSFDCDHETFELGAGGTAVGRLAWGEFGRRVGTPRILDVLQRHGIPATFFMPAVCALIDPDETRRIVAAGHEVGCTAGSTRTTRGWMRRPSAT